MSALRRRFRIALLGVVFAIAGLPACVTVREHRAADVPAIAPAPLPAATPSGVALSHPEAGLIVAGQPAAGDWAALAAVGVRTVVDLRTPGELQGRDEPAEVAAAGLHYVRLPIAGAGAVTPANARQLAALLDEVEGPVLVHCASGNRAGGLLALAKVGEGMSAEDALVYGRSAGMTSSEAKVREAMALPAAVQSAP